MPAAFRLVNNTLALASSRAGNETVSWERKRISIRSLSVPLTHCKIVGETSMGMSHISLTTANMLYKSKEAKKK